MAISFLTEEIEREENSSHRHRGGNTRMEGAILANEGDRKGGRWTEREREGMEEGGWRERVESVQ